MNLRVSTTADESPVKDDGIRGTSPKGDGSS
jgi:hypothetical protein